MNPLSPYSGLVVILIALAGSFSSVFADSGVDIRPITWVRSLPRSALEKGVPVTVRGIVTYKNYNGDFAIQDESGGIWVQLYLSQQRKVWSGNGGVLAELREGARVELLGVPHLGGYSPAILPSTIRILGFGDLPPARPLDRPLFVSGSEAAERIEARGVLLGFQPMTGGWKLRLQSGPDVLYVMALNKVVPDPRSMLDSELRVRGVAASGFNTRGEQLYARLVVSMPGDIIIEKHASLSAFSLPLVPLDQINTFHSEKENPHRLRVEGTVTYALPGQFLYIQDGSRAVRIETQSALPLAPGDRVQVVGYVDMSRHIAMLRAAEVRQIGVGPLPVVSTIHPDQILKINSDAAYNGQAPLPHDFDGHIIRFHATLLAIQSAADTSQPMRRLIVKDGERVLSAELYSGDATKIDSIKAGSELELTGLVQLVYAEVQDSYSLLSPVRLDLVLRTPFDVIVVNAPSWWTAPRLLGLVAAIGLSLAGTLFWNSQLQRQVRAKTNQLAAEMRARRDSAIEFKATLRERNRLAANLHDTILQTISGIGFQMEVCEAETEGDDPNGKANTHFSVARRMLDHAANELRGSVWALRSLPQQGLTLQEALSLMAERARAGHDLQIEVNPAKDLPAVSEFISGNLVLAAQEAVHNSIKHGRPKTIRIDVRPSNKGTSIRMEVKDDGVGFVVGTQVGSSQGHFGLSGMRERIEGLDGSLNIDSAPGAGTTIQIEVPLRSYDENLA